MISRLNQLTGKLSNNTVWCRGTVGLQYDVNQLHFLCTCVMIKLAHVTSILHI